MQTIVNIDLIVTATSKMDQAILFAMFFPTDPLHQTLYTFKSKHPFIFVISCKTQQSLQKIAMQITFSASAQKKTKEWKTETTFQSERAGKKIVDCRSEEKHIGIEV